MLRPEPDAEQAGRHSRSLACSARAAPLIPHPASYSALGRPTRPPARPRAGAGAGAGPILRAARRLGVTFMPAGVLARPVTICLLRLGTTGISMVSPIMPAGVGAGAMAMAEGAGARARSTGFACAQGTRVRAGVEEARSARRRGELCAWRRQRGRVRPSLLGTR